MVGICAEGSLKRLWQGHLSKVGLLLLYVVYNSGVSLDSERRSFLSCSIKRNHTLPATMGDDDRTDRLVLLLWLLYCKGDEPMLDRTFGDGEYRYRSFLA